MARNVTVTTAPGLPTAFFDCSFLATRAKLNRTLRFERVGIVNCYTGNVAGYVEVYSRGRLEFVDVIHHATLCPSFDVILGSLLHGPRPLTAPGEQRLQQVGPGWCDSDPDGAAVAAATGARGAANGSVCAQPAVLMLDVASTTPDVMLGPGAGGVELLYRCARMGVCVLVGGARVGLCYVANTLHRSFGPTQRRNCHTNTSTHHTP
jgi:hypothetical protein